MEERNKDLVRNYIADIVNGARWKMWRHYFAEQVFFNGSSISLQGFQAIISWFLLPMPDMQMTIEDQIAEGDKVATRVTIRGTHSKDFEGIQASRRPIVFPGIALDRISQGRIVEMWHETDMLGALGRASAEAKQKERE